MEFSPSYFNVLVMKTQYYALERNYGKVLFILSKGKKKKRRGKNPLQLKFIQNS